MKILFSSHVFYPSTGGIETVSDCLVRGFIERGHEVRVITQTADPENEDLGFSVTRKPTARELLRLVEWCDIFFHNHISLRTAWPLLVHPKPWVVAIHTWITDSKDSLSLRRRFRHFLLDYPKVVSVSRAIADHLNCNSRIIYNSYDTDIFREHSGGQRDRELICVGRLVSDKGVDVLLDALARLKGEGMCLKLTVVGNGPDLEKLKRQAVSSGIDEQVNFVGNLDRPELVEMLNEHKVIVIPSRWEEPFGLVALEGIACGCVVIASNCGGLPEAVGKCGMLFDKEDAAGLARMISSVLTDEEMRKGFTDCSREHLLQFQPETQIDRYLALFEETIRECQ